MTLVLVEREFDEPVDFGEIQAREDRGAWCLEAHRVTFLRTWFSRDRRQMICLYEAPDAESVRLAQGKAGMPVTRFWSAVRIDPPERPPAATPPGRARVETVVVQRGFDHAFSREAIDQAISLAQPCLIRHDVDYRGGYLSQDGRRMVCVFLAADAEAVRLSNRAAGVPFDRAWSATLHEPRGAAPGRMDTPRPSGVPPEPAPLYIARMNERKIAEDLGTLLASRSTDDMTVVPILVTVKGRPDVSTLEKTGMVVARVFENIPAASGTASRRVIEALTRLDEVERIEHDSGTHAV